jgi:transposase InsO family protein
MAKQTRTPFNKKARRAGRPFELVHTDICGPFPESIDGYKYFVTFTDDYTRYSCTFLLKKKSDVLEAFKRYIRRMKRQFGWKLRRFRSDNGGEYASDALDHVLAKEGIIWEPTIGYSPSENGVSERLNRTLCEKLRALLFESGLPLKLWSRLVETATYLKNRSPTKALRGKTPYEALYKRKPDLSNLTIIGSKAWVAIRTGYYIGRLAERALVSLARLQKYTTATVVNSYDYRLLVSNP